MPYSVPVDLTKVLAGPARILWALSTVARPTKLDDIISLTTPYAPKTGWNDFGATTDSTSAERDMDSEGFEIEQRSSAVMERITSVERQLTVPLAQITPEATQIVEVSPSVQSIAAGAAASGTPAQSRVPFGSIGSLPRYRFAVIAERPPELSASAETGARGQLVGLVYYAASVAAEGSEIELSREDLAGREVTFRAYDDPAVTAAGEQAGCWLFETGASVP